MTDTTNTEQNRVAAGGRLERLISYSTVAELTKKIRRNIRYMHRGLESSEDRDGWLIDYLNHINTLAQQIEIELLVMRHDD